MVNYNVKMIERYMKVHEMTKEGFCDFCGVPLDTVDKMIAKDGTVMSDDLIKVASALYVRVDDLMGRS